MESAEPLVHRDGTMRVIHVNILTVKIVGEIGQMNALVIAYYHAIEIGVPLCRGQTLQKPDIEHMDRVAGQNEVDEKAREVE